MTGTQKSDQSILTKVLMNILQDLTEFNTAHNKRISSIGIEETQAGPSLKRKRRAHMHVGFRDGEDIINPGKNYGIVQQI